jgi:hypothetical protein
VLGTQFLSINQRNHWLSTAVGLTVLSCETHEGAPDDGKPISVQGHVVLNQTDHDVEKFDKAYSNKAAKGSKYLAPTRMFH